jgi:hypothetical protein
MKKIKFETTETKFNRNSNEKQLNLNGEVILQSPKEIYNINNMGVNNMVKVNKSDFTFSNTIKAEDLVEKEVKITEIKEVKTKYGEKMIAVLDDNTQIFLNDLSMNNLIDAFGEETDDYIGKKINLTIETSERTRNKKAIVVIASKNKKKK